MDINVANVDVIGQHDCDHNHDLSLDYDYNHENDHNHDHVNDHDQDHDLHGPARSGFAPLLFSASVLRSYANHIRVLAEQEPGFNLYFTLLTELLERMLSLALAGTFEGFARSHIRLSQPWILTGALKSKKTNISTILRILSHSPSSLSH